MSDEWGPGEKFEVFETGYLGDQNRQPYELGMGEHPHSRSDNNVYARFGDGRIEAFDGHRIQVRIELETFNYLKSSTLTGNQVRKWGTCLIYLNGALADQFGFREPDAALLEAHRRLLAAMEGDYPQLWKGEPEIGRHVYYDSVPAIVDAVMPEGTLVLRAAGQRFRVPPYVIERARFDHSNDPIDEWLAENSEVLTVDIHDPKLWWWRAEETEEVE